MNYLLSSILLLFIGSGFAQQPRINTPSEVATYFGYENELTPLEHSSMKYDENKRIIDSLYQMWDGSAFVNIQRSRYSYSPEGDVIENRIEEWVNETWKTSWLTKSQKIDSVMRYEMYVSGESDSLLLYSVSEFVDNKSAGTMTSTDYESVDGKFIPVRRYRSLRDNHGKTYRYEQFSLISAGNETLDVLEATEYEYSPTGKITKEIITSTYSDSSYMVNATHRTYDAADNMLLQTIEFTSQGELLYSEKTENVYDSNNRMIKSLTSSTKDGKWSLDSRTEYSANESGTRTEEKMWIDSDTAARPAGVTVYLYDDQKRLIEFSYSYYDETLKKYVPAQVSKYIY